MFILAIETSCDETAASVLKDDREVLSNIVLSQDEIHAPYGGVVPELASRRHLQSIGYVVEESLQRAKVRLEEIGLFAVTQGPGLVGSLLVGLSFAKGLAYYFKKPLVGIDHLEAHIEAAFLENPGISFPGLALVVSGGHTSAFLLQERLAYELLGRTRDDAAGEALDKIAKFLDLGYPGGPVIEKLAENGNSRKFPFALPKMTDSSLDFSFSGLKTAALKHIKKAGLSKRHPDLADFLASFEEAVVRAILDEAGRAVETSTPASIILCGGVARNRRLRLGLEEFARLHSLTPYVPSVKLCTDNAAMVGALAIEKFKKPEIEGGKEAIDLTIDAYPRR
jgi:N6-L-threonylcarbamoyladenine synthase